MLDRCKDIISLTLIYKCGFYLCYIRVKTFILRVPRCLTLGKRFPVIDWLENFLNMVPTQGLYTYNEFDRSYGNK